MKYTYNIPKEFTVVEVDHFKEDVYEKAKNNGLDLLIDFSNCDFIDSTGLGAIVSVFKRLNETNGNLILKGMNPMVKDLFVMTRLDKVMNIQ